MLPFATRAAARRSSMRELVHDPMNTRSTAISSMGFPGSSAHVRERLFGRAPVGFLDELFNFGDARVTATTIPGFVPQVTNGAS